uniref:Uncharacterized protein n=1 Tax=Solanum tuberosum TaxID=4113 RepID=M1D3Y5_SOLTU
MEEEYSENAPFSVEDLMHNDPVMKKRLNLILSAMIYRSLIFEVPNSVKYSSMNLAYIAGKARWTMTGVPGVVLCPFSIRRTDENALSEVQEVLYHVHHKNLYDQDQSAAEMLQQ